MVVLCKVVDNSTRHCVVRIDVNILICTTTLVCRKDLQSRESSFLRFTVLALERNMRKIVLTYCITTDLED